MCRVENRIYYGVDTMLLCMCVCVYIYILRRKTLNFIKKTQQYQLGQEKQRVVEQSPSTSKNQKYKSNVLLNYALPYYPLSLHESKVID